MVVLDRVDFFGRERAGTIRSECAKRPVALVPPGTPGDLRHFAHRQPALAIAVELGQAGEGDM